MAKTSIEWTDATWNPVRGCTKISPGCKHCYASTFAERFRGVRNHPYEQGFELRLVPEKLTEPFNWPQSSFVFVNSMSDLFHPDIPDDYIVDVVRVMVAADWHTYQVLTKRAERLSQLLRTKLKFAAKSAHIWWGVSVENVKHGVPRVGWLLKSGAAVKFLSVEPLLEDVSELEVAGIDWVIVGGESGPGARPLKESWVQNIRIKCEALEVAFFFKQWGGTQKKKAGRMLGGRTYDGMPPVSRKQIPTRKERLAKAAEYNPLAIIT